MDAMYEGARKKCYDFRFSYNSKQKIGIKQTELLFFEVEYALKTFTVRLKVLLFLSNILS